MSLLVLTYHAVEEGPPPLCVGPDLFTQHLDVVVRSGVRTLTVSELADCVRRGTLPDRAVAITFDDGMASVARTAGPLLAERGLVATVFAVAGHVGGNNAWESGRRRTPVLELAGVDELRALAADGIEIGSHGFLHEPLTRDTPEDVFRRELVDSQLRLQDLLGAEVTAFAYAYGVCTAEAARRVAKVGYTAACGGELGAVSARSDLFALPRLDAHYVRSPRLLRSALAGSGAAYIALRSVGARTRRVLRKDYSSTRSPVAAER